MAGAVDDSTINIVVVIIIIIIITQPYSMCKPDSNFTLTKLGLL